MDPHLLWYRLDLRLSDHAALAAARASGAPVIPVFIWDPEAEAPWAPGRAGRWWLGESLEALDAELRARGSRLVLRGGETVRTLFDLIRETGARSVHWSRRYEPDWARRDARLKKELESHGISARIHAGNLLREPETLKTQGGTPYKVFTPFRRAFESAGQPVPPLPAPKRIAAPQKWPEGASPRSIGIAIKPEDAGGWGRHWRPGAASAFQALDHFLKNSLEDYAQARDVPADPGTSHLSPFLHFGEITPGQIRHAVAEALNASGGRGMPWSGDPGRMREARGGADVFLKELVWREFAHHVLVHFPDTTHKPLRPEFAAFPWKKDSRALEAWTQGRTGYPFIDAGLRELAATGTMHNRVRMAAASFLIKDLLIPWQEGARHFWESLADADLAVNSMNWQWVAGCGADAAPYFRIFNPTTQGEKFDPHGDYVRRWVPELAGLDDGWIHRPAEAPPLLLSAAGVDLGRNYPKPIVDHKPARERALAAFKTLAAMPREA